MQGIHMHATILATFFEISRTAVSMCSAGILLFLVVLWAAKADIARAGGNLSRYLDCAAGLVHLWADPDRADVRPEHRGQG